MAFLCTKERRPVRISWCGNEDCFNRNKKPILDALGNGTLQWSRDSKSKNLPLHLRFSIAFVPFNADTSIAKSNVGRLEEEEAALLHLFFIQATNFEEYRISVRPEISEWFSHLTTQNSNQSWLILFDSSRIKEKKSRTAVMDKLKSDFARFQNRIFESSDISAEKSMASLSTLLQNNLFSSHDHSINSLTSSIQKLRGAINESTFSPSALINEQVFIFWNFYLIFQFKLINFYWNLGLFEMAQSDLDLLSAFFSDSIRALAQKNEPELNTLPWLKQLRLLPLDKSCPLISQQIFVEKPQQATEDWSLARIYVHLLAYQILLSGQLLDYKLTIANAPSSSSSSSSSTTANEPNQQQLNTLQIRHDFVKQTLGYTKLLFQRLEEDLFILKANYNAVLLDCLFVCLTAEAFKFAELLLGDEKTGTTANASKMFDVVSASSHICFILHKKCEALIHLQSILSNTKQQHHQQEGTIARRWLEQNSFSSSAKIENAKLEQFAQMFKQFSDTFCAGDHVKFGQFVRRELEEAVNVFGRYNWRGHVQYLGDFLARNHSAGTNSYSSMAQKLFNFISGQNGPIQTGGKSAINFIEELLEKCEEQMLQKDPELFFDCSIVLMLLMRENGNFDGEKMAKCEERFQRVLANPPIEIIKKNHHWLTDLQEAPKPTTHRRPLVPFPLQITRICTSPPLLQCCLHQPISIQMELTNLLPTKIECQKISAKFVKIAGNSPLAPPNQLAFRQTQTTAQNSGTFYTLECIPSAKSAAQTKEQMDLVQFEMEANNVCVLEPGRNCCTFESEGCKNVGCFQLDSILVECRTATENAPNNCKFEVSYRHEMSRNRLLEHVLCFVDLVKPSISVLGQQRDGNKENDPNPVAELAAGIRQDFRLELCPGTLPLEQQTLLGVTLVGLENQRLKFLNPSGDWTCGSAQFPIEALKSDAHHPVSIPLCIAIDQVDMDVLSSEEKPEEIADKFELELNWTMPNGELLVHQFVPIRFHPIFTLSSHTSFLAEHAIFILDVRRDNKTSANADCVPLELSLGQEQNIALEPVPAQLLNPKPFAPILPNSSYRFIWKLPDFAIGKSVPVPHFLKLKYQMKQQNTCGNGAQEEAEQQESKEDFYLVEKRLNFTLRRVEYEVCARFYSEYSQSVLCRIDQPCELIISLRSLQASKLAEAETVVVSIEADKEKQPYWHCAERHKLVKVKDSGVGQAIFTIDCQIPDISKIKEIQNKMDESKDWKKERKIQLEQLKNKNTTAAQPQMNGHVQAPPSATIPPLLQTNNHGQQQQQPPVFCPIKDEPAEPKFAKVLYKYDAGAPDELSLPEGAIVSVVSRRCEDDGWFVAELVESRRGLFPDNFVEFLPSEPAENVPLVSANAKQHHDPLNLALYEDKYSGNNRQHISQMSPSPSLHNAILPTSNEDAESTVNGPVSGGNGTPNGKSRNGGSNAEEAAKLGTVMGVYIPCLQNIFAVLFFIRLPWIVGTAGILEAFCVVLLCCSVSFLTSISLSAIATNGAVPGSGPYHMISRNLGRELGGAVGILFYLGTTVAASMYIIGAVEIFLIYIMPKANVFEDMYHNFRLFGSLLLILIWLFFARVEKIVKKFALPSVLIVVACIACTFVGIFLKFDGTKSLQFCMVGDRPVDLSGFQRAHGYVPNCTAEGLRVVFCMDPNKAGGNEILGGMATTTTTTTRASRSRGRIAYSYAQLAVVPNCDRYFESVLQNDPSAIRYEPAIQGISSGVFFENLYSKHRRNGDVLTKLDSQTAHLPPDPNNKRTAFWVFADTTTSFMILVGVFFPSVTGIMAGTNRADNLRDASQSIPIGTLGAQLTTSVVYLLSVVLFGSSVAEMFIRDKFGQSAMGKLVIAELAVPHPLLILIGCCASTIGAGMLSLTGALRLLQAISADDVVPFLGPFKKTDSRGEPIRAIFLTLCICWLGILIGSIENITALITQFFLMCYLGVNSACALQSVMKAPRWRPSFKYFHWSLSALGALLCAVMFGSAWYFALFAIFIGAAVYKYIEYADFQKLQKELTQLPTTAALQEEPLD